MEKDTVAPPIPGTSGIKKVTTSEKSKAAKKNDKVSEDTESSKGAKGKHSMLEMICEAVEVTGVARKGASAQAIRKHILSKHEESEAVRVSNLIKKALVKGIEKGILVRPAVSKDAVGAVGRFMLAKKVDKPKLLKSEIKNKNEELVSDSETTTKKPRKVRKRNLSDEAINDSETIATKPKTKPEKSKLPKVKITTSKKNLINATKTAEEDAEERKDASDSEVVVKKKVRKSLKSYSSDTEVDFVKANKIKKNAGGAKKKQTAKGVESKTKAAKSEPLNAPKVKGAKKLYSNSEEKTDKDKKTKTGKTKPKKET